MDTNTWLWVALIAVLAFCLVPMLFMGRRRNHSERDEQPRPRGEK